MRYSFYRFDSELTTSLSDINRRGIIYFVLRTRVNVEVYSQVYRDFFKGFLVKFEENFGRIDMH